jgi:DNA-binding NarL/FixJ family response regulator
MRNAILLALLALLPLLGLNLFEEYRDGEPITAFVVLVEFIDSGLVIVSIVIAIYMISEIRSINRDRNTLSAALNVSKMEAEKWRRTARSYIVGLRQAIQQQMTDWGFTESETDVAFLILKGLSHQDIARLRNTSEVTVRQQARSIYRKSKCRNRSELAAYFLDDVTAPIGSESESSNIEILHGGIR